MSFDRTLCRLREAVGDPRASGEFCRVRKEDLREILRDWSRLDGRVRETAAPSSVLGPLASHLDNLKHMIVQMTANQAIDRIGVRSETRAYTAQQLHDLLSHVAYSAIEKWNGHIQGDLHMLKIDYDRRWERVRDMSFPVFVAKDEKKD